MSEQKIVCGNCGHQCHRCTDLTPEDPRLIALCLCCKVEFNARIAARYGVSMFKDAG